MRPLPFFHAALFVLASGLAGASAGIAQTPLAISQVTMEPAYPVTLSAAREYKLVEVRIRVQPGTKLSAAKSLTLQLAFGAPQTLANERTFPLTRTQDGAWEATVPFAWNYAVFFVKDAEGSFDNNDGRYWEILACGPDATPTEGAINHQALTYHAGKLSPSIQLQPDNARAVRVLEEDLKRHPERTGHYNNLWSFRAELGGDTAAVYQALAGEIERFATAHADDLKAAEMAFRFVMNNRKRLPPALYDKLFTVVVKKDPKSKLAGEAMYREAREERDPQKKIESYLTFVEKFPEHDEVASAWLGSFYAFYQNLKDIEGAERAFRELVKLDAGRADPYAALARFYVEQKTKLDEAVKLLSRAAELCRSDQPPTHPRRGSAGYILVNCWVPSAEYEAIGRPLLEKDQATIRYWRGQARLLTDDPAGAAEDFAMAARVMADDPKVWLALGQAFEKLSKGQEAFAAYLEAATAPYQTTREPADALARVFFTARMGSSDELDARIATRIRERRIKAAAEYKPTRIDRPAPKFEFTALDGKKVDAAALRGRVAVINFWSTWCAPCLMELPAFIEFQKRNPDVTVLAVEFDSAAAEIRALLERRQLTALNVAMGGKANIFGQSGLPQTYVLDAEGRIQFAHYGALPDVVAVLERDLAALHNK